jgi:transcriptional regulator with XRE-family HTH domain
MIPRHAHKLLDKLIELGGLKYDAELARKLNISPVVISKIRSGRLKVGATLIINIHEEFPISVKDIQELLK